MAEEPTKKGLARTLGEIMLHPERLGGSQEAPDLEGMGDGASFQLPPRPHRKASAALGVLTLALAPQPNALSSE